MFKSLMNLFASGKASIEDVPEKEELEGLNLRKALDTHDAWKEKLNKTLEGNG